MKFICIILTIVVASLTYAQTIAPALPEFPTSPLDSAKIDELTSKDDTKAWSDFSKEAQNKAIDYALKQLYIEAEDWLYTSFAAEIFAKEGADMPKELKAEILKNIPAFTDFYETFRKEDSMKGVCDALTEIFKVYPIQTRKYMRCAYAVALIYDVPPPGVWPECNVPSNPVAITQPQEIFNFFTEDASSLTLPLDKMTVGELIYIFGVAGPMDELKSLKNTKFTPFSIENLATRGIKTDTNRVSGKTYLTWDTTQSPYTLENIKKYGGVPIDKAYYAWRTANANGVPCLFFTETSGGVNYAWLWYMSRPGIWKTDIARDQASKSLFGRPLNPQTWKTIEISDIELLSKRYATTRQGIDSNAFVRFSKIFYDKNDYQNAGIFAERARKENVENPNAYMAYIYARARFGAAENELDNLFKKSYEAFRKYPDMCIIMLNKYRENLSLRRKQKEADRLFLGEMRAVMRTDAGLGMEIYSRQLKELFSNLQNKTEIFASYQDILRNTSNSQSQCLIKIVTPLAEMFAQEGDRKSALKTISMFESALRQDEIATKARLQILKEKYTAPKSKKEKSAAEEDEIPTIF